MLTAFMSAPISIASMKIARTMERRWGIGRLPLLVDPNCACGSIASARSSTSLSAADKAHAIVVQAKGMSRAWQALDAAATAAGAEPLAPEIWECQLPTGGKVVAIVRTSAEARRVAQMVKSGRSTRSQCSSNAWATMYAR